MGCRRFVQVLTAVLVGALLAAGPAPGADAAVRRTLTLAAAPAAVDVGGAVALRGVLSRSPRGTTVLVERREGSRWVRQTSVRTSTADGAYRATVRPSAAGTWTYRARVAQQRVGRKVLAAATSPSRSVVVRATERPRSVTLDLPESLIAFEAIAVSGTITNTPAGRFVRLECRGDDDVWEGCGAGRTTSDGRFTEPEFQVQEVGDYDVRAVVPRETTAEGTLGAATSPTRPLRVYGADNSGATTLVSITDEDNFTESGTRDGSSISGDGRYVAFVTVASDLLAGVDPDGQPNVFLRDTRTSTTRLVSAAPGGGPMAGSDGFEPIESAVSGSGRYVAYTSASPGLVPDDDNELVDVFVRDMVTGTTELASRTSTGAVAAGSELFANGEVSISDDGRSVLFTSRLALVPEDRNGAGDVYVRDLVSGTTSLVTRAEDGVPLPEGGFHGVLSGDATHAVFFSVSEGVGPTGGRERRGVYRRNLRTGAIDQVYFSRDVDNNVVPDSLGLSTDGGRVVYSIGALYLWDADDGRTTGVSRDVDGQPVGRLPSNVVVSGDGSTIAFSTDAEDLVPDDDRGNPAHEVYVYDVATGGTTLASARYDGYFSGVRVVGGSAASGLSDDGDRLAFTSGAPELIRGDDANGPAADVFVRDLSAVIPVGGRAPR